MKLPAALRKSPHKAAILSIPDTSWNFVVVQWAPHEYTTEVHQYNKDGNLDFQIISYRKTDEGYLRARTGEYYFGENWQPYTRDTPRDVVQLKQKEKENRTPVKTKRIIHSLTDQEWDDLVREIYG